jgi:hypothetical protein
MKEIYYTYNNEAIASCIFLSVLQKVGSMDMARSCLILPFLLDDKTVAYLKNHHPSNGGLQEVMSEERRLFTSFNKRYLALLPVSINALILLSKGGQITIEKHILNNSTLNFSEADFGNRFNSVQQAMPIFLTLLEDLSTVQLYQILKIQL